jgi:hypothetical protein
LGRRLGKAVLSGSGAFLKTLTDPTS